MRHCSLLTINISLSETCYLGRILAGLQLYYKVQGGCAKCCVICFEQKVFGLTYLTIKFMGFDVLKDLYKEDVEFGKIWETCAKKPFKDFMIVDGFLFKGMHFVFHLVL